MRKKIVLYIVLVMWLIFNDFYNKGKYVECKFIIYMSYRLYCLVERVLFVIDCRIYKNKNRRYIKEIVDSMFYFKICWV